MLAHVGQRLIFPPEIATTNLRPDIFLWSGSARLVHLVELTVPWEDAVDEADERKKLWYAQLAAEAQQQGWRVRVYPVEICPFRCAGCADSAGGEKERERTSWENGKEKKSLPEKDTERERGNNWADPDECIGQGADRPLPEDERQEQSKGSDNAVAARDPGPTLRSAVGQPTPSQFPDQ
ncbi:UNVERIFIED_CONTAM: hypothetical protein FKN15_024531 [Acipenser sinensis]